MCCLDNERGCKNSETKKVEEEEEKAKILGNNNVKAGRIQDTDVEKTEIRRSGGRKHLIVKCKMT